jgi:hypothetical protein
MIAAEQLDTILAAAAESLASEYAWVMQSAPLSGPFALGLHAAGAGRLRRWMTDMVFGLTTTLRDRTADSACLKA